MKRINLILSHPLFTNHLNRLTQLEKDRVYCCHGLPHLLDTARIACLLQYTKRFPQEAQNTATLSTQTANNPQNNRICFSTELIYAAALLHDIGRVLQYEKNLPHETAGLHTAEYILADCKFTETERKDILAAIQFHHGYDESSSLSQETKYLCDLVHTADVLSRNCFACPAADTCYWPKEKKNKGIVF